MTRKDVLWKQFRKLERNIDNPPPLCDYDHSHAVAEISRELRACSEDKFIFFALLIAFGYLLLDIAEHGK